MANCEFSETQFSFCFVFEILNKYPERLIPLFPTTRQEKKLGYDVEIGGSLFLQFKRPKLLEREQKYQISLKNKNQFEKLFNLKLNKPANKVFYVAPIFHTLEDMRSFYLSSTIENHSALFPLENFPSPEDFNYHHIKYEYCAQNSKQNDVPLTNINSVPTKTYGILNSNPLSIETAHNILSNSDMRDEMSLIKKANFLLQNVTNEIDKREFEIVNPIDQLFSILLVKYNILWIPIR